MSKSIFAIEIAARIDRAPGLLPILREAVAGQGPQMGLQQKWDTYKRASDALVGHLGHIERGCWDYFDDDARADSEFASWLSGMTTEEGARAHPSGRPDPYRGEPRYLTFTMAFLLVRPSKTDDAVRQLCDIPETHYWRRDVFARILGGLGVVSFASVKSDVMYLIPRDDDWGLTSDDLAKPQFGYLRRIQG
jgi:hypothetical protein